MVEFLEKPNDKLSDWSPCPFARKARIENKIKIVFGEDERVRFNILDQIYSLNTYDVIVVCFDHTKISIDELSSIVTDMNKELMYKNVVLLEDHPFDEEYVNGVKMNFGQCALVFIQKLDKLQEASNQLKKKNYYDTWTLEQYNKVVAWREILQNKSQSN